MCDTPNRPVRNATLPPTGHWGTAAFDSSMGHVKHIKHWKPCLWALMCYFGTNNRLLICTLCVILPTGQWGTPYYPQPATEKRLHLTAVWGTWNTLNIENHVWGPWSVISGKIIVCWYIHYVWCSQPTSEERHITPNQPLRKGSCLGVRAHETLKTMSGALMCYLKKNNRLLIYASCVILPTGQWGTPHYSQPANEEWMHLTTYGARESH